MSLRGSLHADAGVRAGVVIEGYEAGYAIQRILVRLEALLAVDYLRLEYCLFLILATVDLLNKLTVFLTSLTSFLVSFTTPLHLFRMLCISTAPLREATAVFLV